MKSHICLAAFLAVMVSSVAYSGARAFFSGGGVVILVEPFSLETGELDEDPQRLYRAMESRSSASRGEMGISGQKVIQIGRDLAISCIARGSEDQIRCQLTIKSGELATVDSAQRSVVLKGDHLELRPLLDGLLRRDDLKEFSYRSTDGRLLLSVDLEGGGIHYQESQSMR